MTNNKKHEPLFHVVKRDKLSFKKSLLIRTISILAAFLFCSLLLIIAYGCSPINFLNSLFNGVFGSERRFWIFLHEIALLLGISLAVAPAFKMKFWNIGADGQTLIGGLACIACMHYLGGKINNGLLIFISLFASIIAGMIWAVIPAIFKAKWRTNETLFTLMMNYIAIQLVTFSINTWVKTGSGTLAPISYGNLPKIFDNAYVLNILIVVLVTILVTVYLKYSKHGFELAVVGEEENTARYAGINVKKVIIRTMLLSGAICGIMGFLLSAGYNHTIAATSVDGRGFTAIIVAWLAKFNPLYMILTSLLFVFLTRGTAQVITDIGITNSAFQNIIIGIFYFFIIGFEFFINYKIMFRKKNEKSNDEEIKPNEVDENTADKVIENTTNNNAKEMN